MAFVPDSQRIEILDPLMVESLRVKTPAERLAMAFDCNRFARLRLAGHVQTQHPDWSDEQIRAVVARRMLLGTS